MISDPPPFIPQEACRGCHGCCRFAQEGTPWAPFFFAEEISGLLSRGVLQERLFNPEDVRRGHGGRIRLAKSDRGEAAHVCPCLEETTNRCAIYSERPFECRLYPFLLHRAPDGIWLALDAHCPYAQAAAPQGVQKYAAEFVKMLGAADFSRRIEDNPGIVSSYEGDLLLMAPLPFLNSIGSPHPQR